MANYKVNTIMDGQNLTGLCLELNANTANPIKLELCDKIFLDGTVWNKFNTSINTNTMCDIESSLGCSDAWISYSNNEIFISVSMAECRATFSYSTKLDKDLIQLFNDIEQILN